MPVVVLSNNDGCVIARSNEAKALGIKMGDAWHLRRAEFERWGVQVRSSNYTLYGDLSARVMRVLSDFTPDLEVYSIDEAFLSLAGFADPDALARQARATVLQKTGIPVCVGISTTKTLAKAANRTAKKDPASGGVCYLPNDKEQTAALAKMDLGDSTWSYSGPSWSCRGHPVWTSNRTVRRAKPSAAAEVSGRSWKGFPSWPRR